ncbi:hypothetical protein [uncultured Erythrobacter sp.]|uniref:tetratricopeptide repeat protein n=1 Tax=uncultured Erythrobacter sp. TaxID=263913 RepID=UPI00263759A8|nr:hypothetical protein [uncultured Erythrobacter sp.]
MRSPFLKIASLLLIASGAVAGVTLLSPSSQAESDALLGRDPKVSYGPANYDAALEAVDRDLALARQRVDRAPKQWLGYEGLALGHLIKAQLSGSFAELSAADAMIGKGLILAGAGKGPAIAASTIDLSLHRYPEALEHIEDYNGFVVKRGEAEKAEMLAQRGEVAFYSGDYSGALTHYRLAFDADPSPNTIFRLATWHKYLGDFDTAIELYTRGALSGRSATPQMLAAYHLQIGALELQRGNWDLAHAYFKRADDLFPGYWLTQAHIAQMLAVEGKRDGAKRMYREIIERTGNPDVMMALASVHEFEGDERAATTLRSQAAELFDKRLEELPEAYFDHALDLALANGDNARALELAKANFEARPYGDAKMALARAHTANGDPRKAAALLEEVVASGWKSVEQHIDLAEAYEALGDRAKSDQQTQMALALNPKSQRPEADLLAFGSH